VLCDTYSFSSSRGVTVTLVRVHEAQRLLTSRRGIIRRLQFAWHLFRATLHATPTTSPADGTGPLASRAAGCFGMGVRPPLPMREDWYELLQLLPDSMRQTC
jgi:hypothetical protein